MSRIRVAAVAALGLIVVSATAEAQRYRFDLGVNGGYGKWSNMLTEEHTGVTDQDVRYKSGILGGAQATLWFGPRLGLRANFGYSDRPLEGDDVPLTMVRSDDLEHINLWSGSGDLMFRFMTPREEWTGPEVLPYLALGLGAKWQNPAGDRYTLNDDAEDKSWAGVPFSTGTVPNQNTFFLSELSTLMGLVGLGADVRMSPNLAIRLELTDRIFDPQLHSTTLPLTGTTFTSTESDEDVGETVHEMSATIGLHMLFGLARVTEVAVIPAPTPAPTPEPTPTPPPAPREESITVCVIDPTAPGGVRMQTATFMVDSGDTLVVVNGTRRPLRDAIGTVTVASTETWYVQGQPFTLNVGSEKIEFVSYGSARMVESDQLSFLGTVNGLPVYAPRDEVADVINELNDLNRAQAGTDLQKILEEHKDLRENLADVKVVYVPLQPTGCVFQALQLQEQVRKNR